MWKLTRHDQKALEKVQEALREPRADGAPIWWDDDEAATAFNAAYLK